MSPQPGSLVMKILFLSPWFPFPPDNGSKIRVYNLLRFLSRQHSLTLIAFCPHAADLSGLDFCSKVIVVNKDPFVKSQLMEAMRFFLPCPFVVYPDKEMSRVVNSELRQEDFSAIIAFTTTVANYVNEVKIPKVLDLDTGLTGFAMERLRLAGGRIRKLQAWISLSKTIRCERELVGQFDATIVISKEGQRSLQPVLTKARQLAIVGHGVDLSYYPFNLEEPEPNSLIYNGALTFSANFDAMQWFLQDIYPRIKTEIPAVRLRITGGGAGVDLNALALDQSVILTGYVPDVRPVVAKSSICIIPIRIGGGQRLKILEAMALGTPVVSTSKGMEGLAINPGEHALIADESASFASSVVQLLRNAEQRKEIAKNARLLMEEKHTWDTILPRFKSVVESVAIST